MGKTRVFTTVGLDVVSQMAATGKVDIILMDWRRPSYEEVLALDEVAHNPFYHMVHGEAQRVIVIDESGTNVMLPDGKVRTLEEMAQEFQDIEIREMWVEHMRAMCRSKGIDMPPCFIIRSEGELSMIAKIIAQKLGLPLS